MPYCYCQHLPDGRLAIVTSNWPDGSPQLARALAKTWFEHCRGWMGVGPEVHYDPAVHTLPMNLHELWRRMDTTELPSDRTNRHLWYLNDTLGAAGPRVDVGAVGLAAAVARVRARLGLGGG